MSGGTGVTRLPNWAANTALAAVSVIAFLLVCEFVVFRFVLPASDVPANDYVDGVVRYAPDQSGTWRVRNEIAAPFTINAQGWNSARGDYEQAGAGAERIAVIGDSYVESLQVPPDANFGEELGRLRGGAEVLRFGISGAPLSQYVRMAEREAAGYAPDWLVVLLIHNDFDESFRYVGGRYTSSFLKVAVEEGHVTGEIEPEPWAPGPWDWLRRSATVRFLVYRWGVRPGSIVSLFVSPAGARPQYEANVAIADVLDDKETIAAVTDHLFGRLERVADGMGARLVLVMDGDRRPIYAGLPGSSRATQLNDMAADLAARRNIPFLDLQPVFESDWAVNGRRFSFETDNHWNDYGHDVAARALNRFLADIEDGAAAP